MSEQRRTRVSSIEEIPVKLRPLRRAESLTDYYLYWIPVRTNPVPQQQRLWINTFLDGVSDYLKSTGLRSEVFLQYKTVYPDLLDTFLDQSLELMPVMGFGRKPGVPLPPVPSKEDIKQLAERLAAGGDLDFASYVGDFIYWFLGKKERKQRELFFGHGGLTMMFLAPDPNTAPPKLPFSPRIKEHPAFRELFARFDVDEVLATGQGLGDKWLKASKELYAADIPKSPITKNVPFIVPLLTSRNFLNEAKEREALCKLCEFYVTESIEDQGVLLASQKDHQDALIDILEHMRERGLDYS